MPIPIRCPNPNCGKSYTAPDEVSGRSVRCGHCGRKFVAPPTLDGNPSETRKSRPASPPGEPFPSLPAAFGRYRVLRLLGRGGMGSVYLAEDSQLGRKVALKLPSFGPGESPQRGERFVREARSAALLQHPNVCTVFDAGQIDGRPFLTMAFIDGKPLEEAIDPDAPMPQEEAARIARKVALALAHAHAKGVVHRDLKPANVMLDAEGEPFVMDFGLAKRVSEDDANEVKLTHHGTVLGTPIYMAPEQVRGQSDRIGPATDVHALGVMLFQMLTGKTPYSGPVGMVMAQILAAPVPRVSEFRPGVDPRLDEACRRAMAKDPADRFPGMAALADALGGFLRQPDEGSVVNVVPVLPLTLPPAPPEHSPFGDLTGNTPAPAARRTRSQGTGPGEEPTPPGRYRQAAGRGGRKLPPSLGAGLLGLLLAAVLLVVLRPKNEESPAGPAGEPKNVEPGTPPRKPAPPAPKATPPGNVEFFNGKDLTGWGGVPSAWKVVNGAIVGKLPGWQDQSTFLCTQREFGNFELRFSVRLLNGAGTSGVQVRSKLVDAAQYDVTGPQVRITSEAIGGVYSHGTGTGWMSLPEADLDRVLEPDEFNAYTIRAVGKRLTVVVNGKAVVDQQFPEMADTGVIAFLLHGTQKVDEVTFKDIEFRELPAGSR
jgi:serine/threonine protein kinase